MEVSVRELRNNTARVVDAVGAGETVTLTVQGEPVADIVPAPSARSLAPGAWLGEQLRDRAADPGLQADLDRLAGGTIDELP